jgi:hypothetical protein
VFGKPHWFRAKAFGWGLIPIRWQGWAYTGAWASAIALPFLLLLARRQPLEALSWIAILVAGLGYDVWLILRSLKTNQVRETRNHPQQQAGIYYISDKRGA